MTLSGTVAAATRGDFLSALITQRHRPVAILFWTNTSEVGSNFSVFLTKSDTEVSEPQPGDPDAFALLNIQTYGTNVFSAPLAQTTIVDPPVRFALSFYNAAATAALIVATYLYEVI